MPRAALVRLSSFLLIVAGTFGTAYGVGTKLPGNPESKPHTHGPAKPSPVPPGFEVDGYVLFNDQSQPSDSSTTFYIKGPDGQRVTDFTETQGAKLHVILTRFDVSGFQHLVPDINADGSFVVPLDHGKWHIIIDTQPASAPAPIVLTTNVDDEVVVGEVSLPKPNDTVITDDLIVTRDGLDFTVTSKDGLPAEAWSRTSANPHTFRDTSGRPRYTHLHPADSSAATFSFTGDLPTGTYRLFLEFGHQGRSSPPRSRWCSHERDVGRGPWDLTLTGMTCACAARIEKTLNRLDGVNASVNLATEKASVALHPDVVSTGDLLAAVESIGYGAACRQLPAQPKLTTRTIAADGCCSDDWSSPSCWVCPYW